MDHQWLCMKALSAGNGRMKTSKAWVFRRGQRFKKIVRLIVHQGDMKIHGIGIGIEQTDEMMTAFYDQNVFQADCNGVKPRLIYTKT